MRTFIALELSEPAKAGILSVIRALRESGVRAGWSRPSTIHLTLRFLGDVENERVPGLLAAVERAARRSQGFRMTTAGLGAFPSPRRPRVIWAGVDAPEELYVLQSAIEDELAGVGFDRERKRFHPHVTLGRLREPGADLGVLLSANRVLEEPTDVTHVRVMKSTLAPSGAVHEVVGELPLAAPHRSPEQEQTSP